MIGGAIGQEQKDHDIFNEEIKPTDIVVGTRMAAELRLYQPDEDVVKRVGFNSVVGQIMIEEPSIEDRQYINIVNAAKMMAEQMLDMHDFKTILEKAAYVMTVDHLTAEPSEEREESLRLVHAIDKMVHELGGYEQ